MNDDDDVIVDPELEMEEREDDDDEEVLPPAVVKIQELQTEFVQGVQKVMEPLITQNPEHRGSIEATAEGILGLIEGGVDDGYVLVKREDANFAMVPATREVYEEHLRDDVEPTGLDLSRGLLAMFDDVNN
jgi:hypothetical protein